MDDPNTPTDETSTALTPAVDTAIADAATPGGDTGVVDVAQQALDQATGQTAQTTDPIELALSSIPENDDDLKTVTDQSQLQTLTGQRNQLRVLGSAIRELQPLKVYQQYGDPKAVSSRLELAKLLYSPVFEADGKTPRRDPETKTPYVTTKPFVQHLDKVSPGMPEQLLVDLLAHETENPALLDTAGNPVREPLVNQVFRFYRLNPSRLEEYVNIDALIARTSGEVTPEELAEIPADYHAAYRTIPASIRNAWKSLDPADQTRTLEDYKDKLDRKARDVEDEKQREQLKAQRIANHQRQVAEATDKYLDTVRRDRTATMIQSLSQQVTFSADANVNKVMIGTLAASMAQLLDPAWRFVVVDHVLTPLGLKLDHTFDTALNTHDTAAADAVAFRLAGDEGQAIVKEQEAVNAANQLMAKLAIFSLKVAKAQGATVTEKAAAQASALTAATAARANVAPGAVSAQPNGVLPPGMVPGSREATDYISRQTGFRP